jgi:hypothetical protein
MDYRGTFEDGMIRPDGPVDLPNGTPVEFHLVDRHQGDQAGEIAKADYLARNPKTFEQIVKEQGIQPLRSLDEIGAPWPDDEDDIDEFIRSIKERE